MSHSTLSDPAISRKWQHIQNNQTILQKAESIAFLTVIQFGGLLSPFPKFNHFLLLIANAPTVPSYKAMECKGPFIATQLNSTRCSVELSCVGEVSIPTPTQLNSTSSCRHIHSVNNCHLSMHVVTQLTQFVGRDVINKNTTDLAVRCSTGSVEFSWVMSL